MTMTDMFKSDTIGEQGDPNRRIMVPGRPGYLRITDGNRIEAINPAGDCHYCIRHHDGKIVWSDQTAVAEHLKQLLYRHLDEALLKGQPFANDAYEPPNDPLPDGVLQTLERMNWHFGRGDLRRVCWFHGQTNSGQVSIELGGVTGAFEFPRFKLNGNRVHFRGRIRNIGFEVR